MQDKEKARKLKERSREAFDTQAATYDEEMKGDHARRLYPIVAEEVASAVVGMKEPKLLDLGCGTGALAELILKTVPSCRLFCIDLSPCMIDVARARIGSHAEISLADAEALPFSEEFFNAVWCNDSFHHYPDPKRAAFEAWRVLKPGGSLIIGDVWQPAPARALMNAWMPYSQEGDVRIYSENEMRTILGTWFDTVEWRKVNSTACICIARKGQCDEDVQSDYLALNSPHSECIVRY